MSTYQRVIIVGRLGRAPELKYTQSGTAVANLSLATDESYKKQDGTKVEQTEWHRVVVWGKQAENVSKYLDKGRLALVEGRLQTRKWQDQQGNDRYSTEVRAERVVFVSGDQGQSSQQSQQQSSEEYGPAFPKDSNSMDSAPF